jgi:ABC-2 type transport system permease protein
MTIRRNLPAWIECARMDNRRMYMYRFNAVFSIVLTGVTIYLLTIVWKSAYAGRSEVGGIAVEQLLVYLTIANLQTRFLNPEIDGDMHERIRQGQIAFDISRPVSYPEQVVAGAAGQMLGSLPMLLLALPVALVAGELQAPPTVGAGIAYVGSLLLAWVIAVELSLIVGLIGFWTLEITGFYTMYRLIGNFATGALIPLWFMPGLVRATVQLLPFQAMAFLPVSVYVGEPATGSTLGALGVQLLWIGLLVFAIRWTWHRAFVHTVIQGG